LLFREGDYLEVTATGKHADQIIAFQRRLGNARLLVVVPRLTYPLGPWPIAAAWSDTFLDGLDLPEGQVWYDVLSQRSIRGEDSLAIEQILSVLPCAALFGHNQS
jgi:(1->4)-alpha-D-glucan 1-alpha-D-glucosylmutase